MKFELNALLKIYYALAEKKSSLYSQNNISSSQRENFLKFPLFLSHPHTIILQRVSYDITLNEIAKNVFYY